MARRTQEIAGQPLMDCSNAQPGIIPLNTETTKQMAQGTLVETMFLIKG